MKTSLTLVLFIAFLVSVYAQDEQKGEMYIPILNGTQNPISVTVAILDGSTPQQKLFLSELAATPRKATFITENLNNQGFQTLSYTSPIIDWITTSSNWPQMQTIVLCGKIALNEQVGVYNVTNQYSFAGWGSAQLQPNMKLEGSLAGLNFTDYCPPYLSSFGAGTETSTPHPVPQDQIAAQVQENNVKMIKDFSPYVGTWMPVSPDNCKLIESKGNLIFSVRDGSPAGSGTIHIVYKNKSGLLQYSDFFYDVDIDSVKARQGAESYYFTLEGSINYHFDYRNGLIDSRHESDPQIDAEGQLYFPFNGTNNILEISTRGPALLLKKVD